MCGDMLSSSWEAENKETGHWNPDKPSQMWMRKDIKAEIDRFHDKVIVPAQYTHSDHFHTILEDLVLAAMGTAQLRYFSVTMSYKSGNIVDNAILMSVSVIVKLRSRSGEG